MVAKVLAVVVAAAAVPSTLMLLARSDGGGIGGGRYVVPEIDGSAGIAALALMVSVGLLLYNRTIRR